MLQLHNKNKEKIKGLRDYKDYCIESVLSTGDRTLSFSYPAKLSDGIEEEGYIITKTNEFVIKEIQDTGDYKSIKAVLNVEDLEGKVWDRFVSTEQTIADCLALALAGTGWLVGTCNITKKRTIVKTCSNTWEIIQEAQKTYRVELEFDTLNKKININDSIGTDKGCYFIDSLNLKALNIQSNSYDYYTRIIAEGKDGLVLADPGYIENYQYSNKIKTLYWKDERYTNIESLTEDATAKLEEMSKPYRSYTATILDLANMNETYKDILAYSLGDVITLISKEKKVKEKQRIVKITEYPDEPTRNTCEIANTKLSFDDIQKEQQQTTDTVNNITSDDGTISESAISVAVSHLIADKADIQDLNVISARIGTIEVNRATVDQLNATNANVVNLLSAVATIDSALINKVNVVDLNATNANLSNLDATVANIQTLVNGNLTSANIQSLVLTSSKVTVDNGFIKNAMIESLDVTKINAGTLNTNKISVSSSDGGLIIAGATQQFKDKNNNVRLQLGQDATGDFNFILRATDGTTTLIDGYGIKANAIADKLIKTNMVADSAIGSGQINYSSFVTGMNASTNTSYIKASKVSIDLTGQTMDIAFNNLSTTVDGVKTTTNTNTTSISTIQGQISTLISNTTITTNGTTTQLKDAYNGTVATVNSMLTTIGEHTSKIDTANANISSVTSKEAALEVTVNSINATLTSTNSTVSTHTTQISTANSNIATLNTNVSSVTSRVTAVELTASGLTTRVGATETAISSLSIGGKNIVRHSNTFNAGSSATASTGITSSLTTEGYLQVVSTSGNGNWFTGWVKDYTEIEGNFVEGEKFTVSFTMKSLDHTSIPMIYLKSGMGYFQLLGTMSTSFSTFYYAGTWKKVNSLAFHFGFAGIAGTTIIKNWKIEKGNKPTDWTPAPEDVDQSILDVKTYATTTINSNVSTINQTTDSIKANVSSLQSSVSTINTTLGNKADTTTVTAISNRTATLETSVTGINASITTLNSNISTVTTNFNNLQVGGRNRAIGTSTPKIGTGFTGSTNYCPSMYTVLSSGLIAGKSVAVSFDFTYTGLTRSSTSALIYLQGNGDVTGWNTGAWQSYALYGLVDWSTGSGTFKVKYTFTASTTFMTNSKWYLNIRTDYITGGSFTVSNFKVEVGNQTTDWTPAPEDTDTQISTINTSVSSLQSSVSVLQSQIALKVEQTQINTAVATLDGKITSTNSTVSSLQAQINVQAGLISSKVEQSTFNSYMSNTNLIQNGDFSYGVTPNTTTVTHWNFWGGACVYSSQGQTNYNVPKTLYIAHPTTSICGMYTENLNLSPNTQYTISFSLGKEGSITSTTCQLEYYDSNNNYLGNATSNFNYDFSKSDTIQSFTFTTPSSFSRAIFSQNSTSNSSTSGYLTRLGYVKLEKGSIATGWGLTDVVGTMVTQSPTSVMTAFNGISSYFQVNSSGATFGNVASGDYTVLGSGGLKHHIGGTNYDYMYVTYMMDASVSIAEETYTVTGQYATEYTDINNHKKDYFVPYDSTLKALLNGRTPKFIMTMSTQRLSSPTKPSSWTATGGNITYSAIMSFNTTNGYGTQAGQVCDANGITIKGMNGIYQKIDTYNAYNMLTNSTINIKTGGTIGVRFLIFA